MNKSRGGIESLLDYVKNDDLEDRISPNSNWMLEKKYLDRDEEGDIIETPKERFYTIAKEVASVEKKYGKDKGEVEEITKSFYKMMTSFDFLPGGRILSNTGTRINSLFNCYVLDVDDSIEDIGKTIGEQMCIHKEGGGTGYNFSKIRPRGSYVKKSKGIASGPVSFMEQFDTATRVMNSGNRRGANMGILNVNHPDVLEFVYAKSKHFSDFISYTKKVLNDAGVEDNILDNIIYLLNDKIKIFENFNLSVGIHDEFMEKVKEDGYYTLEFNGEKFTAEKLRNFVKNVKDNKLGGASVGEEPESLSLYLEGESVFNNYTNKKIGKVSEEGFVELNANKVMNILSELAWDNGDPGVVFLDRIDKDNTLPGMGRITATNPCGEQPLLPYEACDLGSVNLKNMLLKEDGVYKVDYDKLKDTVYKSVRFLDNVNDLSQGPIKQVEEMVKNTRKVGLGVMGWADMLLLMNLSYDSEEAISLAKKVMGFIDETAYQASQDLAEEKGVFPAYDKSIYKDEGVKLRNSARTTIAPTGSISVVAGVNGGIEPYFSNVFYKKTRGGDVLKFINPILEKVAKEEGFYSKKLINKIEENEGSVQGIREVPERVQKVFKVSHDLSYEEHINMQVAFQSKINNAVSKTINLPNSASVEDVKNSYIKAFDKGLKGITVYRDGSRRVQVLENKVKESVKESLLPEYRTPVPVPTIFPSIKIKQPSPFGNIHLTIPYEPISKRPVEIFAQLGKGGDIAYTSLESICRLASVALRTGVKPEEIIHQLKDIKSNLNTLPSREGRVTSLGDAVGRALEKYIYIKKEVGVDNISNGSVNLEEVMGDISDILRKEGNVGEDYNNNNGSIDYSIKCPECGEGRLIRQEGCQHCTHCGFSQC